MLATSHGIQTDDAISLAHAAETLIALRGNDCANPDGASRHIRGRPSQASDGALNYSSSTANDISVAALRAVERRLAPLAPLFAISSDEYSKALTLIRERIRAAYRLRHDTRIIFAASGSDLGYVGIALGRQPSTPALSNILLGIEEISRCAAQTAAGLFCTRETANGSKATPGQPIHPETAAHINVHHIPVRTAAGVPLPPEDVMLNIASAIDEARRMGRHPLVHILHGSKTGLVVPPLSHLDALRRCYGQQMSVIVNACQGRISSVAINDYLARGAAVFLTGSKFLGGPPGSAFALVPASMAAQTSTLPAGLDQIFVRAEWPDDWAGTGALPERPNLGLALRLEAAIFELEVYQTLSAADVRRTVEIFNEATQNLTKRLGVPRLSPSPHGDWQGTTALPVEARTLVTLDLSQMPSRPDLDRGRRFLQSLATELNLFGLKPTEKAAAKQRIHLGAPVKCVALSGDRFGATLSVALSMPQIVELTSLDNGAIEARFKRDMDLIATKLATVEAM